MMTMRLNEILEGLEPAEVAGGTDMEITGLQFDSRKVTAGCLFFALPGTVHDGHDFIPTAIGRGAVAIVCERIPEDAASFPGVTFVRFVDSHAAMGYCARTWYGNPSSKLQLVGVTGTNGKTTLATLLYDMFRKLGYRAGLISTVKYCIEDRVEEATHTTPDVLTLNAMIGAMADAGCGYCFMEVSSHAIVQGRVTGLEFRGGVFTNITHDHLDYHKTFAEYIRAKKRFFDDLPQGAFALVNTDDRNGRVMVQNTRADVCNYSLKGFADFKCRILETHPDGMLLELNRNEVWVNFLGQFNAYNLAAVYGAAVSLGVEADDVLRILSTLTPVRGRFETILSDDGVTAVVDYAHTPDALLNVIETINDIRGGGGRLFVVVGCGGERDKTKRPEMAAIAVDGSDLAVFTSDNPRSEDPKAILDDMEAGVRGRDNRYLVIADRHEAIKTAAKMARKGDYILIAGKGHETYQITGTEKRRFDDREEIAGCFARR